MHFWQTCLIQWFVKKFNLISVHMTERRSYVLLVFTKFHKQTAVNEGCFFFSLPFISQVMSAKMEMDISGVSRAPVSILPAAEVKATLKPEAERPRCASTPCSPIRGTVAGYQILHMDSNYLVGFTTGEELLKLARKWSANTPEKSSVSEALPSSVPSIVPKPVDLGIHRASWIFKAKSRYYQPYDIPAASGRRQKRMPSSSDTFLRSLTHKEPGRSLQGPLPLCLLKGKRAQSKSLDYLNLDKMSIKESSDTEVLQHQLQHLTLRGEPIFNRNKTRNHPEGLFQRHPPSWGFGCYFQLTVSKETLDRQILLFY